MVGWNYVAQRDRAFQSNVPGIDPGNPLAQFGIESAEHKAYVAAKLRNIAYEAVMWETGIVTVTIFLWLLLPAIACETRAAKKT